MDFHFALAFHFNTLAMRGPYSVDAEGSTSQQGRRQQEVEKYAILSPPERRDGIKVNR